MSCFEPEHVEHDELERDRARPDPMQMLHQQHDDGDGDGTGAPPWAQSLLLTNGNPDAPAQTPRLLRKFSTLFRRKKNHAAAVGMKGQVADRAPPPPPTPPPHSPQRASSVGLGSAPHSRQYGSNTGGVSRSRVPSALTSPTLLLDAAYARQNEDERDAAARSVTFSLPTNERLVLDDVPSSTRSSGAMATSARKRKARRKAALLMRERAEGRLFTPDVDVAAPAPVHMTRRTSSGLVGLSSGHATPPHSPNAQQQRAPSPNMSQQQLHVHAQHASANKLAHTKHLLQAQAARRKERMGPPSPSPSVTSSGHCDGDGCNCGRHGYKIPPGYTAACAPAHPRGPGAGSAAGSSGDVRWRAYEGAQTDASGKRSPACALLLAGTILDAEVGMMNELLEFLGQTVDTRECPSRLSACDVNRQVAAYLPKARDRLYAVMTLIGQR